MSEDPTRPAWFTRRNIAPFILSETAIEQIINDANHANVSWVTKDQKTLTHDLNQLLEAETIGADVWRSQS
ncbi:MAG: hypothetical protein ACI9UU_001755 [Candidatus Azotimanducaceae bacterium]